MGRLLKMWSTWVVAGALALGTLAQVPGEMKKNALLKMDMEECSGQMDCKTIKTKVTLDSNWRWLHAAGEAVNCYDGNLWDDEFCPDTATCTENCVLEGVDAADWRDTYGVTSSGDGITLQFVTEGPYSTMLGPEIILWHPMAKSTRCSTSKTESLLLMLMLVSFLVGLTVLFTLWRWTMTVEWKTTHQMWPVLTMVQATATPSVLMT